MLTKQQIAKELLKPYFDDSSTCSADRHGNCVYLNGDGNMCALGKACSDRINDANSMGIDCGAIVLIEEFGWDIINSKYRHIQDFRFWRIIQYCHDMLASHKLSMALKAYKDLTGEEYEE